MTTLTNEVGLVAALHRYPVKSMMGEELNATLVGPKGLWGDRQFAITDLETGKIASAKNPSKWPNLFAYRASYLESTPESTSPPTVRITLPNGDTLTSHDANLDEVLSSRLGKPVRFLSSIPQQAIAEEFALQIEELPKRDEVTDFTLPTQTFFDCAIVHILTTATLDALRKNYPEGRIEPRRFRPNIIISTPPEVTGFVEKDWVGKTLAIGDEVKFKIEGPCPRCIMTTLPQGDLPRDVGILKTAVKFNQGHVGIYASVIQGGKIRRGDTAALE